MNHPAIAKVFDAGSTAEGQPYFVMEYVPGLPITQYCDRKRLPAQERLALFIKVCEGVQHAHQKAIMHRDLKPSNILVVEVDGKPEGEAAHVPLLVKTASPVDFDSPDTPVPANLYRVNFEVRNLKPLSCLAFPICYPANNARKQPSFGDELVTGFSDLCRKEKISAQDRSAGLLV